MRSNPERVPDSFGKCDEEKENTGCPSAGWTHEATVKFPMSQAKRGAFESIL